MYFISVMGPAGSGKSLLTKALSEWMEDMEMSVAKVNFDPAAESLPYVPDVDVRRYVRARDLMFEKGLGPNGALIASVDALINYIVEIREEIDELRANYVIVDLPGQLEIVAFRRLGPQIIKELVRGCKSVSLFLLDARLASSPSSAFSLLLLALSALYRIGLPQILTVNKVDLIIDRPTFEKNPTKLKESLYVIRLFEDEYSCYELMSSQILISNDISINLCESIKQIYSDIVPVSAKEGFGIDVLYGAIQRILAGGEDFLTEEPSGKL